MNQPWIGVVLMTYVTFMCPSPHGDPLHEGGVLALTSDGEDWVRTSPEQQVLLGGADLQGFISVQLTGLE